MMNTSTGRRVGLLILGLLSLADIPEVAVTDGKHPPYAVAALATVLGVVSLVLAVQAVRDPSRSLRLLIGLRILSAVSALPAFFVSDVPGAVRVLAGVFVLLTAVGVVLAARGRELAVAS